MIDDDIASRRMLKEIINRFEDVRLVGEAAGVSEGAHMAKERSPDLVIMEVDLPFRSGFELLPSLEPKTQAIFVTAFDSYAVRAFEFNVIDYLLKPIDQNRLRMAVNRVHRTRTPPPEDKTQNQSSGSEEILLQADGNVHVVDAVNISCIKAVSNYTQVHFSNGKRLLVRRSMESWREELSEHHFCRPHRSLIVNLQLMTQVVRHSRDYSELQIRGHQDPVSVGRRGAIMLQRALAKFRAQPVGSFS